MKDWSKNQKQLMAEFLSNTAVLVLGIGLVNPLFFPVKDIIQLIKQGTFSIVITSLLLLSAFYFLKKDNYGSAN